MMPYEMMVPPFEQVDFDEMDKKQAKEYFDWYIGQIDGRISMLLNTVRYEGVNSTFDYSVESLVPLWEWYEEKVSYRKLDASEYQAKLSQHPEWMRTYITDEVLSLDTLIYCMDVAMYFAEVIVRHNDKIKWGYFTSPKDRMDVNEPVLLGFEFNKVLNPRRIVRNCTRRSGEEKLSTKLLDKYKVWMKYL